MAKKNQNLKKEKKRSEAQQPISELVSVALIPYVGYCLWRMSLILALHLPAILYVSIKEKFSFSFFFF